MGKKVRIAFVIVFASALAWAFFSAVYSNSRYPILYKTEILKSSINHNVQPYIIASLISAESSYRKDVVSEKGAVGLMQVLPSTAIWIATQLGVDDYDEQMLFNAQTNIEFGTFYIGYLIEKFKNLPLAICAYNAGEGTVNLWLRLNLLSTSSVELENIPYAETRGHLQKFEKALLKYKKKYKNFELKT